MPTSKPRFMVTVSDDMHKQIENYRFENRCKSQTQAINELIELGIKRVLTSDGELVEIKNDDPAISDGIDEKEREWLTVYSSLTPSNRRLLLGIAELLLQEQAADPDAQG